MLGLGNSAPLDLQPDANGFDFWLNVLNNFASLMRVIGAVRCADISRVRVDNHAPLACRN